MKILQHGQQHVSIILIKDVRARSKVDELVLYVHVPVTNNRLENN